MRRGGGSTVISSDGVGDDEDFSHDRGQGDFAWAAIGCDETIVEVAQRRGVADGGPGGVEQDAAHERSSVADFGLPASFSAFVCLRGKADESGDLLAAQMAELRQVGDESRGDDRPHAAHRAQRFGEAIERLIAGDVTLDRLFNGVKTLGERADDEIQALANERIARQVRAASLGLARLGQLPASGG